MVRFQEMAKYGRAAGVEFGPVCVVAWLAAALLMVFPTGDGQGRMVAQHQPVTLAAMEGLFETAQGAPLALVGQPDMEHLRLDNPMLILDVLSFLTYRRWKAEVQGLHASPRAAWSQQRIEESSFESSFRMGATAVVTIQGYHGTDSSQE
jgi:cytochrome d ubiquinol oxidase subunit I